MAKRTGGFAEPETARSVSTVPATLTAGAATIASEAARLAKVETRAGAEVAALFLRGVRTRTRAIKAHYKLVKQSIAQSLNDVRKMEATDLAQWEAADLTVAAPLMAFAVAEEVAAEARKQVALAESEAAAVAERDRQAAALRAAAAEAPTQKAERALNRQARAVETSELLPVVDAAVFADPVPLPGVSVPRTWECEVVDLLELARGVVAGTTPIGALKADKVWLDQQATSLGGDLHYRGVRAVEKRSLSARGVV